MFFPLLQPHHLSVLAEERKKYKCEVQSSNSQRNGRGAGRDALSTSGQRDESGRKGDEEARRN